MRRVSALGVVANVESPYAAGNGAQISADGHSAIVNFDIRGDSEKAVDKIDPVIDAVARGGRRAPGALDRRVRRQRREAARREVRQGPRTGRIALAAGHDRDPRDRVRRARRGGYPAAARALGRDGDDGPARDPEPVLAGRREHQRDRAPDRAGRRRRLLDVLLEARARGARGGEERERSSRGRGRHLGPCRPDLRPDGDDRDGRDVPHRRRDVRLVRDGDDPRRRDRGAGLADGAAGTPLVARRPRQQGPRALPPPPPAARGRADVGLDPRPRPGAGRSSRRSPRPPSSSPWRCRRSG